MTAVKYWMRYNGILFIIKVEETHESTLLRRREWYVMIVLMQEVAHMHLKQAEGWDQPECFEEQVKSWTRVLTIIVTSFLYLGVLAAIVAETYHGTACSWYPSCSSLYSLLDSGCCFGKELSIWIQIRLGWTLTSMKSSCSLQGITTYYNELQLITRSRKFVELRMIHDNSSQRHLGDVQNLASPVRVSSLTVPNLWDFEHNGQRLVFQTDLSHSMSCVALIASTWTIRCQFIVVYRDSSERYPRSGLCC